MDLLAPRLGTLRCAFEATGSTRWIMHVIRSHRIDTAHGFQLNINLWGDQAVGRFQATEAALAEGAVDFIDTDWMSIARHRHAGLPITAVFPYGRIMGGLVVAAGTPVQAYADLAGLRIGLVRRQDKNWAVLRAVAKRHHGIDLDAVATVIEAGSKAELRRLLLAGQVDGALLYWHMIPELTGRGNWRVAFDVLDELKVLGIGEVPTTFFAFADRVVEERPELLVAFVNAVRQAVDLMRRDDDVWAAIARDVLNIASGRFPAALRRGWVRRVSLVWTGAVVTDLGNLYATLREFGCGIEDLPPSIPDGTFCEHFIG